MRTIIVVLFVFCLMTPVVAQQGEGDVADVGTQKTISFDFSHRMRFVTWDKGMRSVNGFPVQFTHNRTRFGSTWRPVESLELRATLTNEFFYWIEYPVERKFNPDEVIFEHLYVKWKGQPGFPMDITVGRFDMLLGEGFLIMDGTPLDGSRTLYMNGARVDIGAARDHNVTLFYVHQPEQDDILPIVNDRDKRLAEYVRNVAGVYYTGKYSMIDYELYGIHSEGDGPADPENSNASSLNGNRDLTAGTRLVVHVLPDVTCTLEGAVQRGELRVENAESLNRKAWAAHGNVAWNMKSAIDVPVTLRVGMYHYSYDMMSTSHAEPGTYGWLFLHGQWDPVLGRWPKWNESLMYTKNILPLPGYWTHMQAPFAEVTATPHAEWMIRTSVQVLSWPLKEELGTNRNVGTLLTAHLFWKPDLPVSAHAMLERMWYDSEFDAATPSYIWARLELMYRVEW